MGLRAAHLQGVLRRISGNESIVRLFVVDHLIELIDEYISNEEATKVMAFYLSLNLDEGEYQYRDFEGLLKDVISGQDVPKLVKHRFTVYMNYLFPPPLQT